MIKQPVHIPTPHDIVTTVKSKKFDHCPPGASHQICRSLFFCPVFIIFLKDAALSARTKLFESSFHCGITLRGNDSICHFHFGTILFIIFEFLACALVLSATFVLDKGLCLKFKKQLTSTPNSPCTNLYNVVRSV